jgi:hypothetical protein
MAVAIRENVLACPVCDREFKNPAGLGAHTSRIHKVRPDGRPVASEVVHVTFNFGQKSEIEVDMDRGKAKEILKNYPENVLDALVG